MPLSGGSSHGRKGHMKGGKEPEPGGWAELMGRGMWQLPVGTSGV